MAELIVHWPDGDRTTYPLGQQKTVTIGRAPWNTIELPDERISREHARILFRQGEYWLEDLGGGHHMLVNDETIAANRILSTGDRIDLAEFRIYFTSESLSSDVRLKETAFAVKTVDLPGRSRAPGTTTDPTTLQDASSERLLFSKLDRVGQELIATCPASAVYQMIVDLVAEILAADRVHIVLQDQRDQSLIPRASTKAQGASVDMLMSRSIARQVLDRRRAILIGDAQHDARFRGRESVVLQQIRTAVCAPLWRDNEVLGLIYADRTVSDGAFGTVDLHVMTVIGHLAAVKIRETEAQEELRQR